MPMRRRQKSLRAEMRDDVLQPVVPAVAAAQLELGAARRQVEFVVHHQYLVRQYLVKQRQRDHRTAADVHEGLRLEQMDFMSMHRGACNQAVKLVVGLEIRAVRARKFIHPPESGVVARGFVFPAGVAQSDDQFYVRS